MAYITRAAAYIFGFLCRAERRRNERCFTICARWVYWLCIAAFFGFGVSRLPSWYGYIGVPFIYAVYLLLPAFFIFLFSFVKSLAAVRREKRTGRGAPDYPVDDVVIAWVGAVIFPLLLFFLENRIV